MLRALKLYFYKNGDGIFLWRAARTVLAQKIKSNYYPVANPVQPIARLTYAAHFAAYI